MGSLSYRVKTEKFEGPLDILLNLVSSRKLFINDISLAEVTDDFIRYVEDSEGQRAVYGAGYLAELAEFIVVASTLMLIKSRSLLPMIELTEEEQESIADLEQRLALYAVIKELAATLRDIYGKRVIFEKEPRRNELVVFSPDNKTDTNNLFTAFDELLSSLPKKEAVPKATVRKIVTLEEIIERLADRIASAGKMKFSDFSSKDKINIILAFLAMLELVKRGLIRVNQEMRGEIEMEKQTEPASSNI